MTCWCRFTKCNKGTAQMGDIDNGGGCACMGTRSISFATPPKKLSLLKKNTLPPWLISSHQHDISELMWGRDVCTIDSHKQGGTSLGTNAWMNKWRKKGRKDRRKGEREGGKSTVCKKLVLQLQIQFQFQPRRQRTKESYLWLIQEEGHLSPFGLLLLIPSLVQASTESPAQTSGKWVSLRPWK